MLLASFYNIFLSGSFSLSVCFSDHLPDLDAQQDGELVADQEVEDGVDDAVQKGQRSGQDVQSLDVPERARLHSGPNLRGGDSDVPHHVVRGVEDQEHGCGRSHHPDRPLEGGGPTLQGPFLETEQVRYLVGETAQHQEREDVPGQGEPQAVNKAVDVSLQAGEVLALSPVAPLQVLDHQHYHGRHLDVDHQPAEHGHHERRPPVLQPVVPRWVPDQQEAVHAQQNHEEDGGVEVDVQDVAVDDAQKGIAYGLVVVVDVGKVRQGAEENEVRDGQVEEVNMAALPRRQAEYVTKHNQQVPWETQAELQAVQGRQEVLLQNIIDFCTIKCLKRREEGGGNRGKSQSHNQLMSIKLRLANLT